MKVVTTVVTVRNLKQDADTIWYSWFRKCEIVRQAALLYQRSKLTQQFLHDQIFKDYAKLGVRRFGTSILFGSHLHMSMSQSSYVTDRRNARQEPLRRSSLGTQTVRFQQDKEQSRWFLIICVPRLEPCRGCYLAFRLSVTVCEGPVLAWLTLACGSADEIPSWARWRLQTPKHATPNWTKMPASLLSKRWLLVHAYVLTAETHSYRDSIHFGVLPSNSRYGLLLLSWCIGRPLWWMTPHGSEQCMNNCFKCYCTGSNMVRFQPKTASLRSYTYRKWWVLLS